MQANNRRYDIDWLRVIAIGLLLIYHIAIGFQPWGGMIAFITTKEPWTELWLPMSMLNIWRIPLLFYVSGMGVYFAMQKRTWKELIVERSRRILLPFLFGMVAIVPIHLLIWRKHFHLPLEYTVDPGHLWFLGNIFAYVLIFIPLFYFILKNEESIWIKKLKLLLGQPLGLAIIAFFLVLEAMIIQPMPFELYARTWHGFFLGLLAFLFGFCFVLAGAPFSKMIQKWRWLWLTLACSSFVYRTFVAPGMMPSWLLALESLAWVLTMLSFATKYLNKPSKTLTYLSQAAYPVYILHMIFLYLGSTLFFGLALPAPMLFVIVVLFTAIGCFVSFELIRRVKILRPLFGLK